MSKTYKDLLVWSKAMDLAVKVYCLTENFPKEEIYGLTSQMRRAVVSIPSNIAEGKLRGGSKEFRHFLLIAFGSGGELETQVELAKKLPKTSNLDYSDVEQLLNEVMKMLNGLISSINKLTPKA
ncbi:MAG: four helix bundle protein [Candidatus Paceibacterota bacterium]|jgi:four helix bundle protein